jgi:predicted MPP superfamily phosphohydrolase
VILHNTQVESLTLLLDRCAFLNLSYTLEYARWISEVRNELSPGNEESNHIRFVLVLTGMFYTLLNEEEEAAVAPYITKLSTLKEEVACIERLDAWPYRNNWRM